MLQPQNFTTPQDNRFVPDWQFKAPQVEKKTPSNNDKLINSSAAEEKKET